jgi:hypothetical protein
LRQAVRPRLAGTKETWIGKQVNHGSAKRNDRQLSALENIKLENRNNNLAMPGVRLLTRHFLRVPG